MSSAPSQTMKTWLTTTSRSWRRQRWHRLLILIGVILILWNVSVVRQNSVLVQKDTQDVPETSGFVVARSSLALDWRGSNNGEKDRNAEYVSFSNATESAQTIGGMDGGNVEQTSTENRATSSLVQSSRANDKNRNPPPALTSLNFCQTTNFTPSNDDEAFDVWYPCAGPKYDDFTTSLKAFADDPTRHGPTWGRRSPVLPAHTHILMVGNSHLRQVAHSLLCQHVQQSSSSGAVQMRRIQGNAIQQFQFVQHNSSLTIIANAAVVYSHSWQEELLDLLERPLDSFDAVLLGHLESCAGTGTLAKGLYQATQGECLRYQVSAIEWAMAFEGPILFVSAFSPGLRHFQARAAAQELDAIQQRHTRTNLGFLYGRSHISATHVECAAKSKVTVTDCSDDTVGQRCTGPQGGHADLVSWDVTEFLYSIVQSGTNIFPVPNIREPQVVEENDSDDTDGIVWCNSTDILAPEDFMSDNIAISYQCAGPLYDSFASDMHKYVHNRTLHKPRWGRRPYPAPAHKRVLFWGNSHTRQIIRAMACGQMIRNHVLEVNRISAYQGYQYVLSNNVTLVSVMNSWTPYSNKWKRLLERDLEMSLDSFDAIVVGLFNKCGEDTTFSREMDHFSKVIKDVDCTNVAPPTPVEVKQKFNGPVIFVPMFDGSRDEDMRHNRALIEAQRDPFLAMIDPRMHAYAMQHECLSPKRFSVNDCADQSSDPLSGELNMRHTCCGSKGGTADMVAWDIMEYFHEHL